MTPESAAVLALATLVFVMTPGPGVFTLIARSLQGGVMAGIALMAGLLLADLLYLGAALLGLAYIARDFGALFTLVRWLGGLYLVWLGVRAWYSEARPMTGSATSRRPPGRDLIAGFLTSASNPKVILFYLGLLPNFVDMHAMTPARGAAIMAVVLVSLTGGALIYILLCARLRRLFASQQAVRRLNRSSAVVLIGAGLAVALGGGEHGVTG